MSDPPPISEGPPIPVEPIGYYIASGLPRPGILVAVGTMSIVVGGIGLLFGACGVLYSIVLRNVPVAMAAATAPTTATNTVVFAQTSTTTFLGGAVHTSVKASGIVAHTRMTTPQRQTIIIALNSKQPLSTKRLEMLDMLLAECGDDVLPFEGENITQASVAANVSGSGTTPAGDGTMNDYFILANGRIEVGDDMAVFSPGGGAQSVRVSRPQPGVSATTPTAPTVAWGTAANSSAAPFVLAAITSAVNMLLAIMLLIGGILVLMHRRVGRKLHLIYACAKLPTTLLAGFAYQLVMSQLMRAMTPVATPKIFLAYIIAPTVLGCVYPLALLIVMNTQTVKNYYMNLTVK